VVARGKLDVDEERAQLILEDLRTLDEALLGAVREVHIRAPKARLTEPSALSAFKDVLGRHAGKCLTYLHLGLDGEQEAIFLLGDAYRVAPNESFISEVESVLDPGAVDLR
jgi:hypothetical protein